MIMLFLMHNMLCVQQQIQATLVQIREAEEHAFVIAFIQSRAHLAGFTPCRALEQLVRSDTRDKPEVLSSVELPKSSHLKFKHMGGAFSRVYSAQDKTLILDRIDLNPAYPIIISDCRHAEVHDVVSIKAQKNKLYVVLKKPLQYEYVATFYAGEWVSEAFLIKKNALFYQYHHLDEMTSSVHDMWAHVEQKAGHFLLKLSLNNDGHGFFMRGRNA